MWHKEGKIIIIIIEGEGIYLAQSQLVRHNFSCIGYDATLDHEQAEFNQ